MKKSQNIEELLVGFSGNVPARENIISNAEAKLSKLLPSDFKELLKISNGGEGNIGNQYLIIWAIEELAAYNEQYEVAKYAPGLLVFGSNGGGEAYAFDYRIGSCSGVVKIPFVGMTLQYAEDFAPNFIDFLRRLRNEK